MSDDVRPIIIRRKKVYAAEGHHGGAWKVAYADFVTAMMAFFLLMWLLNATTEQQRKGLADYFNPNIPIAAVSGGGSSALNGDSVFTQETLAQMGTGADTPKTDTSEMDAEQIDAKLESLNRSLQDVNAELLQHIQFKKDNDGLVIELIDTDDDPLFEFGNAKPSTLLGEILQIVTAGMGDVKNGIKIVGHTDSASFPNPERYSNWELSTDRANTARRLMLAYGIDSNQIQEVSGKASTQPLSTDPRAAQNRRISITLLKARQQRSLTSM